MAGGLLRRRQTKPPEEQRGAVCIALYLNSISISNSTRLASTTAPNAAPARLPSPRPTHLLSWKSARFGLSVAPRAPSARRSASAKNPGARYLHSAQRRSTCGVFSLSDSLLAARLKQCAAIAHCTPPRFPSFLQAQIPPTALAATLIRNRGQPDALLPRLSGASTGCRTLESTLASSPGPLHPSPLASALGTHPSPLPGHLLRPPKTLNTTTTRTKSLRAALLQTLPCRSRPSSPSQRLWTTSTVALHIQTT
jgi:hypothetical protein